MTTGSGTALITGASMGIGRELARVFAAHGHSLVLVARGQERLQALADELTAVHKVRVTVRPEDLTDPSVPERLLQDLSREGIEIDYLVNNAGFGSTGPFLDADVRRELDMIQVNVTALTHLTYVFARPMAERGHGGILNIASIAAFQPGPNMAVYYATKGYVLSFTEALAEELSATGVRVTVYCPGPVATEFARTAGNADSVLFRLGAVEPGVVARDAYAALMKGKVLAIHGFRNWLGVQLVRLSPRLLVRKVVAWVNSLT